MGTLVRTIENRITPEVSTIAVIATTTTSARTDISAAAQLSTLATKGDLELVCEGGDVWFFFAASDAGTVDETATSGATRGFYVEAKKPYVFRVATNSAGLPLTWLVHKCSAASKLIRITPLGGAAR